jgi:hypothetical protein
MQSASAATGVPALKGAVVGCGTVLPVIGLVFLSFVDVRSREALAVAILTLGATAGALLGIVAARLQRRRLLRLIGLGMGVYALGVIAYTAFTVIRASSAPASLVPRLVLGVVIGAVTAPFAIPPLLAGLWLLERWTRGPAP